MLSEEAIDNKPTVLVVGPPLTSIGGVASHLQCLMHSGLNSQFNLSYLSVGSAGSAEAPLRRLYRLAYKCYELERLIRLQCPAIVHLNPSMDTKSLIRDSILATISRSAGVKVYFQYHGGRLNKVDLAQRQPFKFLLFKVLERADLITVLSKDQLESLGAVYRQGLGRLNIISLPLLSLDTSQYQNLAFRSRAESDVRFLFMGRVIREKGIFEIIEAFEKVRQQVPNAFLTVAGIGEALDDAKALCATKGLSDSIEFLGFVTDQSKLAVLQRSDVFLLPTWWDEGLPCAVLEVMTTGLPVIASPNGALTEILEDGVHGFLVPPKSAEVLAEKMLRLARDPGLRRTMGLTNQEFAKKHFSLERQKDVYTKLYRHLLAEPRLPAESIVPTLK